MPRQKHQEVSTVSFYDDPSSAKFTFECFDPDVEEFEYYIQRFSIQLAIHNITSEDIQKNLLLSKIGAKPFKVLVDHYKPSPVLSASFTDLIEVLNAYYGSSYCILGERVAFGRRFRQNEETVSQYVNALRSIAGKCQFGGSLNERLRDQLLLGINNSEWQKELLKQHTDPSCKLKDVEQSAISLERAEKTQQDIASWDDSQKHTCKLQQGTYSKTRNMKQDKVYRKNDNFCKQLIRGTHCFRCGGDIHQRSEDCPANGKSCHLCNGANHFSKVCFKEGRARISRNNKNTNMVYYDSHHTSNENLNSDDISIHALQQGNKVMMTALLNQVPIEMLYDPGAAESVISKHIWIKIGSPSLQPTSNLVAYTGVKVNTLGKSIVRVNVFGQEQALPVIVVDHNDYPLFGLRWVLAYNLPLPPGSRVCNVTKEVPPVDSEADVTELLNAYSDVFSDELGTFKGHKAVIKLSDDAVPKAFKHRPIPFALRPAVEEEIDRLVKQGVLERIDPTKTEITWASPIVVCVKSSGKVRICGDFKSTINSYINPIQHPLPRFEDLVTKLQGGQEFTTLDLKDAYFQLEVDELSRQYLVISTPFGYYRYTRVPFGVRSAPGEFQNKIEQVLSGAKGVAQFLDDSIITGRDRKEHLENLREVLERFKKAGIRVQKTKCSFLEKSVTYLGHNIDKTGLHPTDKHLEAIQCMPNPSNVRQLRAFLGAINYYQKFIPRLQCIASPLHRLLKKGVFWDLSVKDVEIINHLKSILTSSDTLVHYDLSLPIIVDTDASDQGLGAVLSHQFADGSIRPVAFASRVLQSSEKKYSVIDREALGIMFAVTKFHDYLYGRPFVLRTDHKPLVHIFGHNSELPRVTNDRLTRWSVTLGAYNFEIKYNEGKSNAPADSLSRLPLQGSTEDFRSSDFGKQILNLRIEDLHITKKILRDKTACDSDIKKVLQYCQGMWPERKSIDLIMHCYYDKRDELSNEDGLLLWKGRIVIPKSLQSLVLNILHEGHPGIVGMRSFARFHVWWPKMDSDIESYVRSCSKCQQFRNKDPEVPLFSWTVPQEPWSRIHVDYAGPYHGFYWLVVVDATTKWLEIFPTKNATTEKTITLLENVFSRFGLPKLIVSDNGPQFTSQLFNTFCCHNNIRHIKTAPYHPRSNGLAERHIQTFKKRFGACKIDSNNLTKCLQTFLFCYRITPHQTTTKSPAEMMYGRPMRTKLSLLKPDVTTNVDAALVRQKKYHDGGRFHWRSFKPGELVWVKVRGGVQEGKIIRRHGNVMYDVEEDGRVQIRHADALNGRGRSVMSW